MAIQFDPGLIGKVLEVTKPQPVTAEAIKQFCSAIGDTNPQYTDEEAARKGPYGGLIAPPSFAITFRHAANLMADVPQFYAKQYDAGTEAEYLRVIRPGDSITLTAKLNEIYEKTGRSGAMAFIVFRLVLTNQNGEEVAYIDQRWLQRD